MVTGRGVGTRGGDLYVSLLYIHIHWHDLQDMIMSPQIYVSPQIQRLYLEMT